MAEMEKFEFKSEVSQLLNIIINSLYSHPEIFLRELISNASDAIDKLRFKSQTDPDILDDDTEFKIKISVDKEKRVLIVSDNGIGMTRQELIENLGTIAKSGTAAFMKALSDAKTKQGLTEELIGQFGVGFYSAFIVSDKVTVISRAAESTEAYCWESAGDGTFIVKQAKREKRGTDVICHLRSKDENMPDFTDEWTIKQIVKKHSDFVRYPIVMDVEREVPEKGPDGKPDPSKMKKEIIEETLNSMKAIWAKNKNKITDEEYNDFYTHISHDWNPPLCRIHTRMEGLTEYTALLYIPAQRPWDLFLPDRKHGIRLYCRRILIMDDCKDLLPEYLRFVYGVVDAPDLNLNISREILQQDALVKNIRKNLTKKVLETLEKMDEKDYEKFYEAFGPILKEGVPLDPENKERISKLLRYKTTRSEGRWRSLDNYISDMPEDQKHIYYLSGESLQVLKNNPRLESLKKKGFEVLLMTDPVDEWVVNTLSEYNGKSFKSAETGDLDIGEKDKEKEEEYSGLLKRIRIHLQDKVKEVKASSHLVDSVACFSGEDGKMSAFMERILKAAGQKIEEEKPILEVNLNHPFLKKMQECFHKDENNPELPEYSKILYDLAIISDGGKLENPAAFNKKAAELMARGISA